MEQEYCLMTESPSGHSVGINPNQVLYIKELADMTCEIVFDDDLKVVVVGTVASVAGQLQRATA